MLTESQDIEVEQPQKPKITTNQSSRKSKANLKSTASNKSLVSQDSTSVSNFGGLSEGSVVQNIANQTYQKEARKFKEFFGKTYMESATIHLWGNKYRYVSDDPIFSLQEPVNPASVKLPDVPETQCPCCYRELDKKDIKTMSNCQFCSMKACSECVKKKREFPEQKAFEGAEPQMGNICMLCERKFWMRKFQKENTQLKSQHNEIDELMVQLRKRGKWAIQIQNELTQQRQQLKEKVADHEQFMTEKQDALASKQSKIDEIVELAARTEISIKSEENELKKVNNELSKSKIDQTFLNQQVEDLTMEYQETEALLRRLEEKRKKEWEKEHKFSDDEDDSMQHNSLTDTYDQNNKLNEQDNYKELLSKSMERKGPSERGDGRLTVVGEDSDEESQRGTTVHGMARRGSIVSRASEKGLSSKDNRQTQQEKAKRQQSNKTNKNKKDKSCGEGCYLF